MMAAKIKKGDRVVVLAGKDKGKQGDVLRVVPTDGRAFVQGVNVVKRHTKPSATNPGGIVEKEAGIHLSNLAHIDPKDSKPCRVAFKILEDGRKVRVSSRTGESIDR
ncbi:MAG: 50S ribosomal protein L24 [Rhodospirillales bacterium]